LLRPLPISTLFPYTTLFRSLVEVCAFAAQQRLHAACSVSVAITEVINVTRRTCSLANNGRARFEPHRLPRGLKSFSKIRFSFREIGRASCRERVERWVGWGI